MNQRTDYYEELEKQYANMGGLKRDGEQISKGDGNSGNIRSGIGETDEAVLPDTQTKS